MVVGSVVESGLVVVSMMGMVMVGVGTVVVMVGMVLSVVALVVSLVVVSVVSVVMEGLSVVSAVREAEGLSVGAVVSMVESPALLVVVRISGMLGGY